jgi:hypothetical protein
VHPGYLVERDGQQCRTEVKEFSYESNPMNDRSGAFSMKETLKPIRGQVHQAARKLRKAQGLGHLLVIVLTEPLNAMFGMLRPFEIDAALRGDLNVVVPVSQRPHRGRPGSGAGTTASCVATIPTSRPWLWCASGPAAEPSRTRTSLTRPKRCLCLTRSSAIPARRSSTTHPTTTTS